MYQQTKNKGSRTRNNEGVIRVAGQKLKVKNKGSGTRDHVGVIRVAGQKLKVKIKAPEQEITWV
jgi:hypothetical protein